MSSLSIYRDLHGLPIPYRECVSRGAAGDPPFAPPDFDALSAISTH